MALYGSLSTMPLTDLLQWISTARKSGTLEVERNKVVKRIALREGRVAACSSDDPPERLGHFLVSRGKITEDTLREALARQETRREHLGAILVGMHALSSEELTRHLAAKAEETIFSLFDWEDAEFRFDENQVADPNLFLVSLHVEEILLRGLSRYDESRRIREVIHDHGMVFRKTGRQPPIEVYQNRMARRIYDAIDGQRTVAEVLLHAHGSEFLVTKFLYELSRSEMIEVSGLRPVAHDPGAASPPVAPPVAETVAKRRAPAVRPAVQPPVAAAAAVPAVSPPPPVGTAKPASAAELEVARGLMARGEYDGALEILNAAYRAQPGDEALRKLVAEAEAAFLEKAYKHYLPPDKIPVLQCPAATLTSEKLSPAEFFLLSRIDGSWTIKSITQITPMREVDVLRSLKRMREKGLITLKSQD